MSVVPSISILTPVWNGLPYLKETVESVLAQDYQDWEMIIADNASTDGTTEYLQSLTDPRIKVYRHETNLGVYRNNHFLFTKAKAPIYVGLCADDYFYPGALRKVVDEWKAVAPEVGLITFNWKHRQMNHDRLSRLSYALLPNVLSGVESTFAFFLFGCFPGNFSEISGKVAVVAPEHYLYNVRFSADYEYWLRLAKKNPFYLSNTDGVVYVRRHDRVAATYAITKGEYLEESVQVYENIINDLSQYCSRNKLLTFYNIDVCSFHLRNALKAATRGRFEAIKSFMNLRSPIFWPKGIQVLACLPFALSERLRYFFNVRLARDIFKHSK
jgi:glycosyltransferase involved in cell wall biosynthesis